VEHELIIFVFCFGGGPWSEKPGRVHVLMAFHGRLCLRGDKGTAEAYPCTISGLGTFAATHNKGSSLTTCGTATHFRFSYVVDFSCWPTNGVGPFEHIEVLIISVRVL
jgi:hypothetical protein